MKKLWYFPNVKGGPMYVAFGQQDEARTTVSRSSMIVAACEHLVNGKQVRVVFNDDNNITTYCDSSAATIAVMLKDLQDCDIAMVTLMED